MEKKQLLNISFIIWFGCILTGTILKIMHYAYGEMSLAIVIIGYLVFACMVIYEICQFHRIERIEKSMCIIGVFFFGVIAELLYLVNGRKRLVDKIEISNI